MGKRKFGKKLKKFGFTQRAKCNTCEKTKKWTQFYCAYRADGSPYYKHGYDCKDCSNAKSHAWAKAHPASRRKSRQKYWKKAPTSLIHSRAKSRAKRDKIEFTITVEDIILPEVCPFLGTKLIPYTQEGNKRARENSPSLDRIDSTKGYIKGNIIVISWRANTIKNDASFKEFEKIYMNWKALHEQKNIDTI